MRVAAVSRDSPYSHIEWAKRLGLNFPLLSDWNGEAVHGFGVEDLVYRTVQELVTNARKHARADRLKIVLVEVDGELRATVSDDGVGFELDEALDRTSMRHHFGLDSAIERLNLAGGALQLTTSPGNGTIVRLSIPLPDATAS